MGSTCVTVDGAGYGYAEEVFLRVKNWMDARNKPHPYIEVERLYSRYEWWIDQLSGSILPLLAISVLSLYLAGKLSEPQRITMIPIIIALFFTLRAAGNHVNTNMASWASGEVHSCQRSEARAAPNGQMSVLQGFNSYVVKSMLILRQN